MKAILQDAYGSPEALAPRDLETPRAGDGEVLVRVQATASTPGCGAS